DHKKDNAYYALRVEDVGVVFDTTKEEKREKESTKIELDKINPPITNILKEFFITRVEVLLRDLRESDELSIPFVLKDVLVKNLEIMPAKERTGTNYGELSAKGEVFDGQITINGRVNPFHRPQILSLNVKIENVSLVKLNPYLKRFAQVDAKEGKISVFIESAVKGENVEGSIEFATEKAEMVKGWQEGQPFLKNLKENVMDLGFRLLNKGDDDETVTGRIPFTGKVDEIKWGFWELFETLLTNAVARPLTGSIEDNLELNGK
ncbi:MAG: DUF748 domain-containing protein, partial [Bacteriovoracaceae bacterium]|nr:DUF748 domain-containing protein [Bacteriovoracaceae bacterium]